MESSIYKNQELLFDSADFVAKFANVSFAAGITAVRLHLNISGTQCIISYTHTWSMQSKRCIDRKLLCIKYYILQIFT